MTSKRRWTPQEEALVLSLREQGLSYQEIADKVRPGQKTAWRKVGDICRKASVDDPQEAPPSLEAPQPMKGTALVSMARDDRVTHLLKKLRTSSRGKAIFVALDDDQQKLFFEMYEEVIKELESMTSAEDQMLMQGLLAYCQYVRAAQMAQQCEAAFDDSIKGFLEEDDPRRQLVGLSERYKSEQEKKHKEYMTNMEKLKATRDQRLKSVTDQRKSFGELQREFASKQKRVSVAAEILKVQEFTDDELKRLLAGGAGPDGEHRPWLIGEFDGVDA